MFFMISFMNGFIKNIFTLRPLVIAIFFLSITGALCSQDLDSFRLGLSSFQDGFYDLSEESFSDFLIENPGSVYADKARYYLGISQVKQAKYSEAVATFLLLADKKHFTYIQNTRYFLAIAAFMTGDYQLSNRFCSILLTGSLEADKKEKIVFIQIQNHINLGDKEGALELSAAYFENTDYTKYRKDVLKYLTNYFMESKDFADAVQTLEMLFLEEPGGMEEQQVLYHNYLTALRELSEYDKAAVFFEKNITFYDNELYLLCSDIYYSNNQKEKALLLLEKIQNTEYSLEAARKGAVIYIEQKEYDRAIAALLPREENPEIAQIIGDIYLRKDDKRKAYDYFSSVPFESLDRVSYIQLLSLALELDKQPTLELCYGKRERFDTIPGDQRNVLLYKLAEAFFNRAAYKKAAVLLTAWSSEFVDDAKYDAVLYMQGLCFYKAEDFDRALLSFSTLQSMNKKDTFYYESFVDKGEVYFSLKEYRSAIDNYKKYLKNRVSEDRKKECSLQMANAYYNIKLYDLAYKTYRAYESDWGESQPVRDKVGRTLLKAQNYEEIVEYYGKKKDLNDFARYLVIYACYKLEDYSELTAFSREYLTYSSSEYYYDILYLSILGFTKLREFHQLYDSYQKHAFSLDPEHKPGSSEEAKITMIKHEYFKAFLKIRKLNEALSLFEEESDVETTLFIAEHLYKHLYLEEALALIKEFKNPRLLDTLELSKILFFIEASKTARRYDDALFYLNYLMEKEEDNLIIQRELFYVVIATEDPRTFAAFRRAYRKNDPEINKVLDTVTAYYDSGDKGSYKKKIVSLLNKMDINNKVTQTLLGHLVRLEYADEKYKEVIKIIASIPAKKLGTLSPEFKFLEARSYLAIEKENKAVKEFLKIFYMYSYEIYWIEKSVREILAVYEKNGQTDKKERLVKMFEEKYFILP